MRQRYHAELKNYVAKGLSILAMIILLMFIWLG